MAWLVVRKGQTPGNGGPVQVTNVWFKWYGFDVFPPDNPRPDNTRPDNTRPDKRLAWWRAPDRSVGGLS